MANQVHLRDFYYNSYSNQQTRHAALTDAVNACGWNAVYDRLSIVTDLNVQNNTESAPNMQNDLEWLKTLQVVQQPNVQQKKELVVRLRDYGYSSMQVGERRHDALIKAVESVGKLDVINRLKEVSELAKEPRRSIYIQDMQWVNAYKVPPPTPVYDGSDDGSDKSITEDYEEDDNDVEQEIMVTENHIVDNTSDKLKVENFDKLKVEKINKVLLEMENYMNTVFLEIEKKMKAALALVS